MHPALRAIGYGDSLRDKAVIAAHVATVGAFPVGIAARKTGRPIPDPRAKLGGYTVRGPHAGLFVCPASSKPYFVEVGNGYEPGMCRGSSTSSRAASLSTWVRLWGSSLRALHAASSGLSRMKPHPVRFEYLERNVKLNGLTNVTCVQCAPLGSRGEGSITLYDLDPSLGPHRLDASTRPGPGDRFDVPLRRLDDLVQGEVSLLKIDVEGAELDVLAGAEKLLASHPRIIVESQNHSTLPNSPPSAHVLVRGNRHG